MNKFAFVMLIGIGCFSQNCFAQFDGEPIQIVEKGLFKKKVYKKCDIEMTPTQMITLFKNDPNMSAYYKPVALNYAASKLLTAAAWVLVLWPVTQSIGDHEDPNWDLAYIGAGCAVLSIPFTMAFNKKAAAAVNY